MKKRTANARSEGHSRDQRAGVINHDKKQKHEDTHKKKVGHLKKQAVNKTTNLDHNQEHEHHPAKKNHDGRAARVHPNKRKPLKHKAHAVTPA
jgi:hypothetical protein